ncbi:UDP-N-acetylglucosamine 2-epimerase [Gracilinema caldarium]|uniref:UDP-N-acetyl-D-glucosamine 2-epimerase, UDP-hydrolysing n=1 Tax=Gracilinema caldarium (strain ATCC 51460 / DSM 7334 / H1) TaxID=744872 RepID=F8F020_GRAC1|nr:UDP-N-acetylglucosamine 2-epimerase [Gracilinema caldarium]AEJ18673.1 UDP-N-acetyl-D-glucosamine 2-epimerase, UDP-hydrolysing [Gracilinema caldarium DSM 7334]
MVKKKLAFFTGTRAEYGLLRPLMDLALKDSDLQFELYVTGMHLSLEFGHTVDQIKQDRIPITEEIEILLSGDTPTAITKSMGLALIGFGDILKKRKPDMLVILGDRFEAFCVAAAATVAHIPIAHLHGGELTLGAIDDTFRHSITKMSYLHFVATEQYKQRVIQLGEFPDRVFNVGAIGIDNILKLKLLDKNEIQNVISDKIKYPYVVITFHPETIDCQSAEDQIKEILKALDKFNDMFLIFTKANSDAGGRIINTLIEEFVSRNPDRSILFSSLGQLKYLSLIKHSLMVIGNSSSGIIEAPSLNVPTVNIGKRQDGRIKAKSVYDCGLFANDIYKTINNVKEDIKNNRINYENPYYKKDTTITIYDTIKKYLNYNKFIKNFFDLTLKY